MSCLLDRIGRRRAESLHLVNAGYSSVLRCFEDLMAFAYLSSCCFNVAVSLSSFLPPESILLKCTVTTRSCTPQARAAAAATVAAAAIQHFPAGCSRASAKFALPSGTVTLNPPPAIRQHSLFLMPARVDAPSPPPAAATETAASAACPDMVSTDTGCGGVGRAPPKCLHGDSGACRRVSHFFFPCINVCGLRC